MPDQSDALLNAVMEIRELIQLMAEPAIAQRNEKRRTALRQIVGKSVVKANVVFMMDGSRTQAEIRQLVKIDQSDLSKLVKLLRTSELLSADDKPQLTISIPAKFFESSEGQL